MQTKSQTTKRNVFEIVANHIIEHLEHGTIPWHNTWTTATMPKNLISNKPYHAINLWLLNALGYPNNYFLTLRQAQKIGARIRKGEKGTIIVYWTKEQREDRQTHEKKMVPTLKYSFVFNIDQCENIPLDKIPLPSIAKKDDPITACENILWNMRNCPQIFHDRERPYYDPVFDSINMPNRDQFLSIELYYSRLFHLLVHSTGHYDRLFRKELMERKSFSSYRYSMEELVAEMGACYLCSYTGIEFETTFDQVEYINEWVKRIKLEPKMIMQASVLAQKATDFILNIGKENKAIENEEMVSHEQAA